MDSNIQQSLPTIVYTDFEVYVHLLQQQRLQGHLCVANQGEKHDIFFEEALRCSEIVKYRNLNQEIVDVRFFFLLSTQIQLHTLTQY